MSYESSALEHWARQLRAWTIPQEILDQAPEDPWRCPVGLFKAKTTREQQRPDTPSRVRALESLPEGGSVLDVGVGGGGASLPLAHRAGHITGVDENPKMLGSFAQAAEDAGVGHDEVEGRWPEIAPTSPVADVVLCHHVFYNVADLADFAAALTDHARRRVVVEIPASHPQTVNNYLWKHFWGVERPTGPTALDALAVLKGVGIDAQAQEWQRPPRWNLEEDREGLVSFVRRNLCLPPEREPEVDALIDAPQRRTDSTAYTLWWDGAAR